MTIHAWKHWFWITAFATVIYQVAANPPPVLPSSLSGVAALPVTISTERRPRVDAPSTQGPNAIEDPGSRFSADMDDTFNGESSDMVIPYYPVKKYHAKNSEPVKKYKTKPLKSQETSERIINVVEEEFEANIVQHSSTIEPLSVDISNVTEVAGNETVNDEPDENVTVSEYVTENYAEDVTTSVESLELDGKMAVAAATSVEQEVYHPSGMDAGSITGITLGIVVISGLFGAISFVLYRRRYLNKPQVLNDKSSTLDSSGYIDDTSLRVGKPAAIETCMRFKENSEEMYSLDNDSFLNSLEAMTIQNYWTESVKHTKL